MAYGLIIYRIRRPILRQKFMIQHTLFISKNFTHAHFYLFLLTN